MSDIGDLERIRDFIRDDTLFRFIVLATSPEYLVGRSSAFYTKDVRKVPFPRSRSDLALSPVEEALVEDALEHVAEFKRKGDEATVLAEPSSEHLRLFGELFCRVLGSVHHGLRPLDPVRVASGICYPFCFGKRPSEALGKGVTRARNLEALLSADVGTSLRCRRILRVFRGNLLLLVKPPQLRYWLRSIAVRDADEIFADLHARGY